MGKKGPCIVYKQIENQADCQSNEMQILNWVGGESYELLLGRGFALVGILCVENPNLVGTRELKA